MRDSEASARRNFSQFASSRSRTGGELRPTVPNAWKRANRAQAQGTVAMGDVLDGEIRAQVADLVDASGRRTIKRGCLAACATVAALASIAVTPGRTFAGTYVMRSCNLPAQPAATMGPWRSVPSPSIALVDN